MSDTIGSVPLPPGYIPNFEHPKDIFHTTNLVVNLLCLAIVTPILLLRLYTRYRIQHAMNREDWACLVAGILFIPYISSNILMGFMNGGYHQWEVTELGLQHFMTAEYVSAVLYGPTVCAIKITLLLLFTRIFAPSQQTVILTYAIMILITLFYVPMLFIKIRMCVPISGFWNRNLNAKCINEGKLFLADTLISVVSDTAVLVLPLPSVSKLRLPLRTKMRIMGLLGAGVLATATTVVRLVLLVRGGVGSDLTFNVLRFSLLGSAEASIGLICASLPVFNAFFANIKSKTGLSQANKSTKKQATAPMIIEGNLSFGSAKKSPRKGEIWRTDESILHRTYVGIEDGKDEADLRRDLELALIPESKFSPPTAATMKMAGLPEVQINGDLWMGEIAEDEKRNKPLPLLPLPPIERLSQLSIWQEIKEVAELRSASLEVGHVSFQQNEDGKDEKRYGVEGPAKRSKSILKKPEQSWENR